MTNSEITQAILNINPNAEFVLRGDDLSGLEWIGTDNPPSEKAITDEIKLLPQRATEKTAQKAALLERLGITADEAALLIQK
jgi:hypothetical protein